MTGEQNLELLLKTMKPQHNIGEYVFCVVKDLKTVTLEDVIMVFREQEGTTVVLKKELADRLNLDYSFIASWITLTVHSSLQAVGLTAAFSNALAKKELAVMWLRDFIMTIYLLTTKKSIKQWKR